MTEPKCTLRDAWMTLNSKRDTFTGYERRSFDLLLQVAEDLVIYYDESENCETTSGADDAAALYAVLTRAGMPVE